MTEGPFFSPERFSLLTLRLPRAGFVGHSWALLVGSMPGGWAPEIIALDPPWGSSTKIAFRGLFLPQPETQDAAYYGG